MVVRDDLFPRWIKKKDPCAGDTDLRARKSVHPVESMPNRARKSGHLATAESVPKHEFPAGNHGAGVGRGKRRGAPIRLITWDVGDGQRELNALKVKLAALTA
jgi:hypothetical protein